MLMLTGENLQSAKVATSSPSVRVARTMDGGNGHYLFVWLEVNNTASPEKITLQVSTAGGERTAQFRLEQRDPAGAGTSNSQGFNGFTADDVIYLIMPDRFADGDQANNFPESGAYDRNQPRAYHGGDLRGIQERLPYIKDLGATALWITPIYNNDDHTGRDYHGYGAVDLYSVEEHFGTLEEYRSGARRPRAGTQGSCRYRSKPYWPGEPMGGNPPTMHWLHGTRENHLTSNAEFQHLVGPHASPREWRNIVEGWFVGVLPDMATDDPVTSQYLRQNALWWAETAAWMVSAWILFPMSTASSGMTFTPTCIGCIRGSAPWRSFRVRSGSCCVLCRRQDYGRNRHGSRYGF